MKHTFKFLLGTFVFVLRCSISFAGKIRLEPSQGEFISQCPFEIDVMVDMGGVESTTVGVSFFIDDTVFALNEFDSAGGIFPAYTSFVRGKARHGDKKGQQVISIMGTTAQKKGVKGAGKFVTLKILPLLGAQSMNLEFYALPGFLADDSNINYMSGDTVYDALTEAIGGSYTFVAGECPLYEEPIPISENDQVILKTQEKKPFFWHQMPFFQKAGTWLTNNIQYIIISLLVLFILFFLFFKKEKKDKK